MDLADDWTPPKFSRPSVVVRPINVPVARARSRKQFADSSEATSLGKRSRDSTLGPSLPLVPGLTTVAAVLTNPFPSDVCLELPHLGKKLWTSEKLLTASAPYFKTLLSSDFMEGTAGTVTSGQNARSAQTSPHREFDDSDDETDASFYHDDHLSADPATSQVKFPHKLIPVRETAYSTYFAALLYFTTRHIDFAPLKSLFRASEVMQSPAGDKNRLASLGKIQKRTPEMPLPASPKSVYRLAHILDCPNLQQRALKNFEEQLTADNAGHELFSDVAGAYPAIRDAALAYISNSWAQISKSSQWQKTKESALNGELRTEAAHTALLLAEAMAAKASR